MEAISPATVVFPAIVFAVAFFLGWLTGHLRDNATTQALMDKIEALKSELKHREWQLKNATEHEAFLDHENAVLNKELDRRQNIINAYKIGQKPKPDQPQMPDEIPDELLTSPHL